MSLVEYKSPVLKKPRFGWQRYQFGNKTAAELKTSLWDANLTEIKIVNGSSPLYGGTNVTVKVTGLDLGSSTVIAYNTKLISTSKVLDVIQLLKFLNEKTPFCGQFTNEEGKLFLTLDRTLSESGSKIVSWKLDVTIS